MSHITLSIETIYQKILSDVEEVGLSEDQVANLVDSLCPEYLVEYSHDDDSVVYGSRPGLSWSDFVDLDDPIQKQILLYVVNNPKTFFVLYNTQKGKSRISSREMGKWAVEPDLKVVSIVIVDNDKTLADQSSDGFLKNIDNSEVITLSSNSSVNIDQILDKIHAYGADVHGIYNKKMPVIVALQNPAQMKKIVRIMAEIKRLANFPQFPSPLRYGVIVDEADKTYPAIRETLLPFIRDPVALHQIGFVSATDGDLFDDYEECYNAKMYQADSDSADYRAIHTRDSVIHRINLNSRKQSPNDYAEMIMRDHADHFFRSISLASGEIYFPKIIVNGNTSVRDMEKFAKSRVVAGFHALTFNQSGIKVYQEGEAVKTYKTKGKKFNELLMEIYTSLRLDQKPMVIIGRRKVDRGLGFHYPDPRGGLIFTDVILGHIEDRNTAVQKAGRGAGIIAQCPQYSGEVHYWTDDKTACSVLNHNRVVDAANSLSGAHSVLQAYTTAREQVQFESPTLLRTPDYIVCNITFASKIEAEQWCERNCQWTITKTNRRGEQTTKTYGTSACGLYRFDADSNEYRPANPRNATHFTWRKGTHWPRGKREIESEEDTRASSDLGWGAEDSARIIPVFGEDREIRYIVIYKPARR
jgi:hypothetical protein